MKLNFIWVFAFAVTSTVIVAACGSNGGNTYPIDGGGDVTIKSDGHVPIFETGGRDGHAGNCNPLTCKLLGYTCGPAGDGCGSSLNCGTCKSPETCGGGGKFSQCGGASACVKKTCADLGIDCGPAGDGCGGALDCGKCTAPAYCGAGGKPSTCGVFVPPDAGPDAGPICTPTTCSALGITCGPAGDGCGGSLSCGTCTVPGETCGGGGTPSKCGSTTTTCVPKKCTDLGFNCGPAGDGCGGALDCGACMSPMKCGSVKPGVCGPGGAPDGGLDGGYCVPMTCASQGINCGPAGDGCGDALACGSCSVPGDTCGGGGMPGKCGHNTACVPTTCAKLGFTCGPWGDGCGGSLSCGSCVSPNICGGGGISGQCGDIVSCTGLCKDVPTCTAGKTTTISGTVIAGTQAPWLGASPSVPDPVPNVLVYIPNGPSVDPLVDGPACGCAPVTGDPLVIGGVVLSANTDFQGNFSISGIPVPPSGILPLVIQLGQWRRVFGLGNPLNPGFPVTACGPNPQGTLHMPRNKSEGDIPLTAVSTGSVDQLECVLLKMGVDAAEFTDPSGTGRIHVYQGNGAKIDATTPPETTLVPNAISSTELDKYDQVLFPCWGVDPVPVGNADHKTVNEQTNVLNYTTIGGRAFMTHYSYGWLYNIAPFSTAANWVPNTRSDGSGTGNIQQPSAFADVNTFYAWMNALTTNGAGVAPLPAGAFNIVSPRNDFNTPAANTELWVNITVPPTYPVTFTFNTPYSTATPPPAACGKVIFSDFHVVAGAGGTTFPAECGAGGEMSPQEKSLEYLIWDLAACPPGPPPATCTPDTCAGLGFTCGNVSDGCGGMLACGTCTLPCQVCGGGGTPGVCGGTCCVPETCGSLGLSCGPAGDGCGGTLDCGTCTPPLTCGGGGISGKCGSPPDAGACTPETCAILGYSCGTVPDGCGGTLNCGTCSSCETCGGGGVAGVCGGTCCVPETCAAEGISCGPAGDGCGGSLDCGPCAPPATCGGGGKPGVCGAPDGSACVPITCAAQGIDCGPAGDGCGGALSCGVCPMGMTCGGGGVPGKCGAPMCTPKTCMQLGFNCGPAGDGCGGTLNCGKCVSPDTCGGGGQAGVCGTGGPPK